MRGKIPVLEQAFVGQFADHHAFLLSTMLARIDETSGRGLVGVDQAAGVAPWRRFQERP